LRAFDKHRPGEPLEPAIADPLQGRRGTQQRARIGGRQVEGTVNADGREPVVAQQTRELRGAEGVAGAERRAIGARPNAAAVGCDHQEPAVSGHHPPDFLQHVAQMLAAFDGMDQEDTVDRGIGNGKIGFIHQGGGIRPFRRPVQHALLRRHQRQNAAGVAHELAQQWRRIAKAQHRFAAHVRPDLPDSAP
jgi:hypothetical protein